MSTTSALKANNLGELKGAFVVPPNVPAGTKLVQFLGGGGSMGEATYTGSGQIRVDTVRRVSTLLTQRFDPLAQTFTLQQGRHLAAIDLWFTTKGTKPIRLQIRETSTGLPNQQVLAQTTLQSSDIKVDGTTTRFEFSPVFLNANQEYALVVLTDDTSYELAIAELGKFDPDNGWVTSQPYQVGVLLSSSNASTWTPHQSMDMAFRLLAARFSNNARTVPLGDVEADKITDWLPLAVVERPGSETDLRFRFKLKDQTGPYYTSQEWEPLNLPENLTGKLEVEAVLTGSETRSPVLYPGVQAALGQVQQTAEYITRAIPCRTGIDDKTKLTVAFEAFLPGQASVDVFAQINDSWQPVTLDSGNEIGDGWQSRKLILSDVTSTQVRVKLQLKGSAKDRPRVRALRVLTT
ncbi:hypothetical protein [Pseudoalteromonas denitrificans]|uniref:Uncharacterized protein n=1 Tax=Pseudoalteromonas denitrificans DSM 6059 TaxID=1123010 RepID=A0A1I1QEM1_9GAMM|nr:hypothetical protein [Pseudoalteromonas denitrificans]SFD16570.1 hypothetical protein SAMN02745724_03719 [Pseudoalteromonas denitrificans DSM 6059]